MKSFSEFLNEASLSRFWQHIQDGNAIAIISNAIAIISADRDERFSSENKSKTLELRRFVRDAGFGYVKVVGGYTEVKNDGYENHVDNETSSIIYAEAKRERELLKLVCWLGERFEQDSVLFVDTKGNASWYYTRDTIKHSKGEVESLGKFHPVQIGKYYSKIGKKHFSFSKIEEDVIPSKKTTNQMRTEDETRELLRRAVEEDISLQEMIDKQ